GRLRQGKISLRTPGNRNVNIQFFQAFLNSLNKGIPRFVPAKVLQDDGNGLCAGSQTFHYRYPERMIAHNIVGYFNKILFFLADATAVVTGSHEFDLVEWDNYGITYTFASALK